MSVAYEPRRFLHDDGTYPPMDDDVDHGATPDADPDQFTVPTHVAAVGVVVPVTTVGIVVPVSAVSAVDPVAVVDPVGAVGAVDPGVTVNAVDPVDSVVSELVTTVATFSVPHAQYVAAAEPRLDLPTAAPSPTPAAPTSKETSPAASTPQRSRAIPKPVRVVTRNADGKFVCTWATCKEEVREFNRKCEWSKHMDKHERPYKCISPGCSKLPGFTYSGGLIRHEREVHNISGGPRNLFYCPHLNCKRHEGKGFSRQENLNEHLRRVHTQNVTAPNGGAVDTTPVGTASVDGETTDATPSREVTPGVCLKRKRSTVTEMREEIKRVRDENEELRRRVESQNEQTMMMMQKITALQHALETRLAAELPGTPML